MNADPAIDFSKTRPDSRFAQICCPFPATPAKKIRPGTTWITSIIHFYSLVQLFWTFRRSKNLHKKCRHPETTSRLIFLTFSTLHEALFSTNFYAFYEINFWYQPWPVNSGKKLLNDRVLWNWSSVVGPATRPLIDIYEQKGAKNKATALQHMILFRNKATLILNHGFMSRLRNSLKPKGPKSHRKNILFLDFNRRNFGFWNSFEQKF